MKPLALPYRHVTEREPSELKKIFVGFLFGFAIEIIFFLIAAASLAILWFLFFHCIHMNDAQQQWIYDPYEVKYITIVIGGYKRRAAVRQYFRKHKILCHA